MGHSARRGNWLGRVLDRGGNTVKTLCSLGFTQEIQKVVTQSIRGGGTEAQTISLRDFNRLIAYGVMAKKKAALALQIAFTELSLNDFFRDAFGERPLSIEEKRNLFYQAYAQTISPEMWQEMQKEDILRLALAGDHLYFPEYRDWEYIQPWRRARKTARKITPKQVSQPSLEVGEWAAQGDVNFLRIPAENSLHLSKAETPIQLAPGQTKGSRHCIAQRDMHLVAFYAPLLDSPLSCGVMQCLGDVEVTHPEHANLILEEGIYLVTYQRKYAEDLRRSQD